MSPKRVHFLSIHESTRSSIILMFLIIIIFLHVILSTGESDAEILRRFKASLKNTAALSGWDDRPGSPPPCNRSAEIWHGVLCNGKGNVWGLKLEKMGLEGAIDVDTLTKLPDLRTISVMHNKFEGPFPNLTKIGALKTIYLSGNRFSGEIPGGSFSRMKWLKKLHLANNRFSGSIPTSLTELPRLIELKLENNEFSGQLPNFKQKILRHFNASNNQLHGPIPAALSHLNASSFSGNERMCGKPLQACPPDAKKDPTAKEKDPADVATIVIISVLVTAAVIALIALIIVLHRRGNKSSSASGSAAQPPPSDRAATSAAAAADLEQGRPAASAGSATPPDSNLHSGRPSLKLTFLKEDGERFDINDLLKSSAEVLGSGVMSSTYKALLDDGNKTMAVKRFRMMNSVSREEFNEHMRRLGRLNHENLLPLLAYYYRKEEKLLVMEYVDNYSVAYHLHGSRSRGTILDWPTRLSIIKGVGRGLLYLNQELPSVTAPHGHLKAANVLLDNAFKPLLSDYGFVPIVNRDHAEDYMVCYKSPEFQTTGRITRKSDVWSFGILILEMLTGRFPSKLLQQGGAGDVDLARWVDSVVRDGGMEVFDGDMVAAGTSSSDPSRGEMMKLLKIGLSCCTADIDHRPEIGEAVEKIEEIREREGGNVEDEYYSSYASEGEMRSSRGMSDDFKND